MTWMRQGIAQSGFGRGILMKNQIQVQQSRKFGWLIDFIQDEARKFIIPIQDIVELLPRSEYALDLGSGQGLLIEKMLYKVSRVTGVDYDKRKCDMARKRLSNYLNRVGIVESDLISFLENVDNSSIETIIISDTLASIPFEDQDKVLRMALQKLKKDGLLLIKIMDLIPKWKAFLSRQVSNTIYKILKLSISKDQRLCYQSHLDYERKLREFGADTKVVIMHKMFFPHVVILARKL